MSRSGSDREGSSSELRSRRHVSVASSRSTMVDELPVSQTYTIHRHWFRVVYGCETLRDSRLISMLRCSYQSCAMNPRCLYDTITTGTSVAQAHDTMLSYSPGPIQKSNTHWVQGGQERAQGSRLVPSFQSLVLTQRFADLVQRSRREIPKL